MVYLFVADTRSSPVLKCPTDIPLVYLFLGIGEETFSVIYNLQKHKSYQSIVHFNQNESNKITTQRHKNLPVFSTDNVMNIRSGNAIKLAS